jgi:hypothetical protein
MADVFFTVDPDGLDALRGRLDHVEAGLRDIGRIADSYSPLDFGPGGAVWNALQKFDASWSNGLAAIGQNLTSLENLLDKAATDYRGTDEQIAQAAAHPGPSAS